MDKENTVFKHQKLFAPYLRVLRVLEDCFPRVDEPTRDIIESAIETECEYHPELSYLRAFNRIEIEVRV